MKNSSEQIIELKPELENHFACPECKTKDPIVKDIALQPVYVLADCKCKNCGLEFYQTFSSGHSVEGHLSIQKSGKQSVYSQQESWLPEALRKIYQVVVDKDLPIERRVFKNTRA